MSETQTTLRDTYSEAFDEHVAETPQEPVEVKPVVEEVKTEVLETKPGRTAGRERDEHGKLLPGPAKKEEVITPVVTRPARPSSWKKDYEKDWETLDPRLAAYINQREQEYAKGVSTYKQEWDRAKPVLDALAPYIEQYTRYGIKPEQLVQNLAAAHQALALGNPQQKLQQFARLAQQYGVDLRAFAPRPPQLDADGRPLPPNPQVQLQKWLQQQMAPVRQELQQFKAAQAEHQQAQVAGEIERFKAANEHEHFEALKGTMAMLLEKGVVQDLESAYSTALRLPQHDDIWTAMQEEKRKAEVTKRAEEARLSAISAKKKAPQLKSSSPGSSVAADGKKSLRDSYADAYDSATGRV